MLHSPEGDDIKYMVRLDFPTTNNKAEYEALVAELDLIKAVGATNIVVYCDSLVVTSQVNGDYEWKGEIMKKYLEQIRKWVGELWIKFVQISKEENEQADCLAKAASQNTCSSPVKYFLLFSLHL